jgi:hypothetical protein
MHLTVTFADYGLIRQSCGVSLKTWAFAFCTPVGEDDREDRTTVLDQTFAANVNTAVMLLYDIRGNPQAKAGAFRPFRRKECLENVLFRLKTDPVTGVGYGHPDAMIKGLPIGSRPHLDFELAAIGHRLDSIINQVHQSLANLSREAHKLRRIFRLEFNFYPGRLDLAPKQSHH